MNSISADFRKFKFREDGLKNYFDSPDFTDKLFLNDLPEDGVPDFTEEFERQLETFGFTFSVFKIKLSLIQPDLSVSGKTIEQFFSDDLDGHCIECRVKWNGKTFGGEVDIPKIIFPKTTTENDYDCIVMLYSLEKSFMDYGAHKPPLPGSFDNFFNDYISHFHFRQTAEDLLPLYLNIDTTKLDWVTRIGYEPVLVTELWQRLWHWNRLNETESWKLFEDLCIFYALAYRITFEANDFGNYFNIEFAICFRDEGFSDVTLEIDNETLEEGYFLDQDNVQYYIFKTMKGYFLVLNEDNIDDSIYYGTLLIKDRLYSNDGYVSNSQTYQEEHFWVTGGQIFCIGMQPPAIKVMEKETKIIEANYYFKLLFQNENPLQRDYYFFAQRGDGLIHAFLNPDPIHKFRNKWVSFPRMFTKAGYSMPTHQIPGSDIKLIFIQSNGTPNIHNIWYQLIENTAVPAYQFLLSGLKKTFNAVLTLIRNANINLFDKTIRNGIKYILIRLSNLNPKEYSVESEWLELERERN